VSRLRLAVALGGAPALAWGAAPAGARVLEATATGFQVQHESDGRPGGCFCERMAPAVDAMLGEQFVRLRRLLEPAAP
jgi:hypothetical protein